MRTQSKIIAGVGMAMGAYYLGCTALRQMRRFSFEDKVAVVTGGSRGLGLEIARQLIQRGARVAFCSRSERDVDAALDEFEDVRPKVMGMVCDIRDREQVRALNDCVLETWGHIHVLFNVAGVMEVGPLDSMTMDDFRDSMDTNCWGALHMILSVLPAMRKQRWGRIVNVASVGGKQAVPHMLPYDASKFALVGLSNGLRTELAKDGILVTTACPTLMRTGSPRNAVFKGNNRAEFSWFDIGGSLPVVSVDSEQAAVQIINACQNGDREVFIANFLNPITWAIRLAPELTAEMLTQINRILPPFGGIGQNSAYGYQSESALAPSWVTQLSDKAAQRNHE